MDQNSCILVCVTGQKECARLIHRGRELAQEYALPLHVLHVCTGKSMLGSADAAEALNYLYALAREADAEMNILYAADVADTLCAYAREHGAAIIVLGVTGSKHPDAGMPSALRLLLPDVSFEICEAQ